MIEADMEQANKEKTLFEAGYTSTGSHRMI
jgi:hypothetical protein